MALAMVDLLLPLARAASPKVYTGVPPPYWRPLRVHRLGESVDGRLFAAGETAYREDITTRQFARSSSSNDILGRWGVMSSLSFTGKRSAVRVRQFHQFLEHVFVGG
jgi:hypothetical protein